MKIKMQMREEKHKITSVSLTKQKLNKETFTMGLGSLKTMIYNSPSLFLILFLPEVVFAASWLLP